MRGTLAKQIKAVTQNRKEYRAAKKLYKRMRRGF
jgi:hypothetical protein